MIVDLPRFIAAESAAWHELEEYLGSLASEPNRSLSLEEARRFHFLYQKTSADLGRVATFASEPDLRRYLESLVARAYAEIHETRGHRSVRWTPFRWFFLTFPTAFRRHVNAFWLSFAITLLGAIFGGAAVMLDDEAKAAIVPGGFEHVLQDPSKRVAEEESAGKDRMGGGHASFAAQLMQNNIGVSIKTMALGMTWGIGSVLMLFYNGVLLGLVAVDFVNAGQSVFLLGWLLPHGSIELPAIIIAGQAAFVFARAMIGRGDRASFAARLRAVGPDVATIIGGVAVMLVWAGLVESYFSQHHQPALPYWVKISFGTVELLALIALLSSGWWMRRKILPQT
jgi:uncharacterized membrane protein SpoIIM required for sporulation